MKSRLRPSCSRGVRAVVAAALIVGASSASAHAATTSGTCPASATSEPFAQFGDTNAYSLVPGGNFESGLKGWTVAGGAGTVSGSETFNATGSRGKYSLNLPAGSTAQSPTMCVTAAEPTFRLFAMSPKSGSSVVAQVVYQSLLGPVGVPVGVISPTSSWQPTAAMLTGAGLASALTGGSAQISLKFTAVGGAAQIDDIFVDPRMKS